jgi:hypothetical protein
MDTMQLLKDDQAKSIYQAYVFWHGQKRALQEIAKRYNSTIKAVEHAAYFW